MSASMSSYCDTAQNTLESDDIAGIESLYPPTSGGQAPAAPAQLAVALSGSSPTSALTLAWQDNANNETGYRVERSTNGSTFAQIVSLDPILAVVEVAERKLHDLKLGDPAEIRLVTGHTAQGKIRFISKTASPATRTYRVDVEIPNADGYIPDGITAEVTVPLAPTPTTRWR